MPKREKAAPSIAEVGNIKKDVKFKDKPYTLSLTDKVSDVDGVIESHLNYEPQFRPKGTKTRGNYSVGICLEGCKCPYHKKRKKK